MKNLIIQKERGLKCDNSNCDWKDLSIKIDDYLEWLNAPCPKCGQNVLTKEDYNNVLILLATVNFINSLSAEEIGYLTNKVDVDSLETSEMFKDATGLANLSDRNVFVEISFETHKKIKVTNLKKL